jgi:hypothetical protein
MRRPFFASLSPFTHFDAITLHFQQQEEAVHQAAIPLDELVARLRQRQAQQKKSE